MNTLRSAFGFACAFTLLGACSSSSSSPGDVSQDQAAHDIAAALCNQFGKCAPALLALGYASADDCTTRSARGVAPAFKANGTSLTVSQLESCAHDLGGLSCSDFLGRNFPQSCRVQPGTLTDGAACGADQQCQHGLCRKNADAECGACSSLGKEGDKCTKDAECDYGLACPAGTQRCVPVANAGQSCEPNHPCNPTLTCKSGVCATPDGAGQPCKADNAGGTCDKVQGYYCDPNALVCSKIKYAQKGEACGFASATACGASGTCSAPLSGQCIAPADDGQACDLSKGIGCTTPAHCVNRICTIDDPATCH